MFGAELAGQLLGRGLALCVCAEVGCVHELACPCGAEIPAGGIGLLLDQPHPGVAEAIQDSLGQTAAMTVYLAGASRTGIGAFCGVFEQTPAPALGSVVVKAALQRAGVPGDRVDEVIFGNVIGAGLGQNVARQVTIGAGLSPAVGATTVNKVCGSGLKAVMLAAQAVQCGDAGVVVAGGTENMSRAPYLLEKARVSYRMGHGELVDSMIRDG